MKQSLFIVDAFFHGNHSFRAAHAFNVINLIDYILRVRGVTGPYFTKNIEFSGGNVGNGYKRNMADAFQNKLGL
jgi:hypothetical protein